MVTEFQQSLPGWLREIYPFESKSFDTGRGLMNYVDEGHGDEAVLMVHGNPTWSFYYRNLVLGLRDQIRCIVPDHLGCGLSEKPQGFHYTLGEHVKNLRALVDRLGLRKIHLIVHDWGGPIGLGTMLPQIERLGNVVILNTAAFADTVVPLRIRLCRAPLIGELLVRGFNGFAGPAAWMSVTKPLAPAVKDAFLFPYDNWHNRIATHRFVVDIPSGRGTVSDAALAEVESRLPKLRERNVRILWGGQDFCFNRHYFDRWQKLLPAAEATYFDEAGHYVLEDAQDECLTEIRRFLVKS